MWMSRKNEHVYNATFVATCQQCGIDHLLDLMQYRRNPPRTEDIGAEAQDSRCYGCDAPMTFQLVGVHLSGFKLVREDEG